VQKPDSANDMDALADTLANRFVGTALHRLSLTESHIPERAENRAAYDARIRAKLDTLKRRPLLMLPRPEPATALAEVPDGAPRHLLWRRRTYRIIRAHGPERIAPEWWRGNARELTRDYYWVEDQTGVRLWIYRHGLYENTAVAPTWYVHGLDG
jgi:protein ImuB